MAYSGAKLGHPVHIHGHSFQVLKIGFPIQNQTSGKILQANPDITCDNKHCSLSHWSAGAPKDLKFEDPPLKDTVIVPSYGYVVVRFISDNPGYWLAHCHVGNHLAEGMGMIFNESFPHQPPAPPGFPTCQEFSQDHSSFSVYLKKNKECLDDSKDCAHIGTGGSSKENKDCQDTWIYLVITCCALICALLALVVNILLWRALKGNCVQERTIFNEGMGMKSLIKET
ncbi:laccase-2-like [Exaiptasia diaphana]|uniref:Plastocyanin-like domain-containing protein n=1 Tax=Exaiptasia diaphana TaxID=2652724 RepID=A0A913YKC9_EXADI|nr:laccase-2-like [Exaiptasia diaphana]